METHDLHAALRTLGALRIGEATTEAEAAASMRMLTSCNRCAIGLVRFSGQTPWERHLDDEFLHVLEGEVELTLLPASGAPLHSTLRAGSVCVVPKGRWHRQHAAATTALMFATSEEGNEASDAEDPR